MKKFLSAAIALFMLSAGSAFAQLPSVNLRTIDGKTIDTATLNNDGKPFIISFFASWCKPCNRELSNIAEVYEDWQDETGVKLFAVSIDEAQNAQKVKPFVDNHGWEYDVLLDPNSDFRRALGVAMIPHVFIVDGKGNIVESRSGYTEGSEGHLIEKVREILEGKATAPKATEEYQYHPLLQRMKYRNMAAIALTLGTALTASAQAFDADSDDEWKKWRITGSIQSDVLVPQDDETIGTEKTDNWALTNTYVQLGAINKYIEAGARLEFNEYPLPGFEPDFKGWGVPFYYVKGNFKGFELTGGTFYDQFGSGLIFRTYEERSLGIDNSLRGARLVLKPFKGVTLKALGGQQRHYWHKRNLSSSKPFTWGGDLELNVDQWVKAMDDHNTSLSLGFSAVSNHAGEEPDILVTRTGATDPATGVALPQAYKLNMPKNVGAFDVRANLQTGNYNFLAEYAWKGHDPSSANNYTFQKGQTLLLSGSYSKRGTSVLLQAKRSQDMAFRSQRTLTNASSACYINHLPTFAYQHTYALAALYPYATQMAPGEWAFQGELGYTFKRKTALGGKYGTHVKLNVSHVRGIDQQAGPGHTNEVGGNGAQSDFFKMGDETYYQDINVQVEKKLNKQLKLNFMYSNQRYNQLIVEGHGERAVKSHIFVAEDKYQLSTK